MKDLLLKSGLLVLMLLLIKSAFVGFYGDKFVYQNAGVNGNKYELEYRRSEFDKQEYDTVFIGSSRTALGISPSYFDFLTKKTKSYNFGIISGMPPKTFDWCEELIQTKRSLKFVFFELGGGFVENSTADANAADRFLLTFFKPSVPRQEFENVYYDFKLPLQNISLEKFLETKSVAAVPSRIFSLQTIHLMRSRGISIEEDRNPTFNAKREYWERVSELIKLAETKQVRLYFFIPPRLNSDREVELLSPIYQKLEEKYKLRVRHYDESLYQPESSLDNSHLNRQGAKKFTELMAEAFIRQNCGASR